MPLPTISAVIASDEYDAFLTILKDDADFPPTHERWLENSAQQDAQCRARGEVLKKVIVNPQEFSDYCRATGQNPSLTMLGIFAAFKAHRNP